MAELTKIALHSVPRSGSTWLGSILDSHPNVAYRFQPLFSYGHKSQLSPKSTSDEIDVFFSDILNTKDSFVLQKDAIASGKVPQFKKSKITSHLVYKEVRFHHILENLLLKTSDVKVVGLIRNPLSTIHSWLRAPKEFRADLGWSVEIEWYKAPNKNQGKPEEYNGFFKWKEAAYIFEDLYEKYPDRFKIVVYEDLLSNPESIVRNLFEFLGLNMNAQTNEFLQIKKINKDPYSVFRVPDILKEQKLDLPNYIVEKVEKELIGTPLMKYLNGISRY
jgi:hypothetical protein